MDVRRLTVARLLSEGVPAEEVWRTYADAASSDTLGAYLHLVAEVPDLDGEWPIPLAVKDMFCTAGIPTTAASAALASYVPPYTATAVARAERRGLRVLGKTNMDEFAMGGSNEHSAVRPVSNPWDPSRVAGGSSGGSAAAVAGGLAPWALGSDTGGSVRQPASFCGIVGMKPSYGAVSRHGMIAFASSLDQCGVLARSVEDAGMLLSTVAGTDRHDMTTVDLSLSPTRSPVDLRSIRLGYVPAWFDGADEGVEQSVRDALERCRDAGATLVEVDLPHVDAAVAAYYIIACAEASSNLARYDGVRYGDAEEATTVEALYAAARGRIGAEAARRIMLGTHVLSEGHLEAYYERAARARAWIAADFDACFARVDCLCSPVAPTVAYPIGERVDDPIRMYLGDLYTIPPSLAGLPALSIPAADVDGLPVGLQLVGRRGEDGYLLDVAAAVERLLPTPPDAWRSR